MDNITSTRQGKGIMNFSNERESVDYDKEIECFYSMLSVRAPEMDEKSMDARKAIDLALVVDVSGSMGGSKIELVKKTLLFLVQEMQDTDRVSIILFDSYVEILQELTKMTPENKVIISEKIREIKDRGSTNLSGGLVMGLDILAKRKEKNEICSCLLFTDGEANCGLRSNREIMEMITGQREHPTIQMYESSLVKQHLSRRKEGVKVPQLNYVNEGMTIYTFGFGARHSGDLLKGISEAGCGMYYFIENNEAIADSFVDCLGGLMSIVCKNIRLTLIPEKGAEIKRIHTVYKHERLSDGSFVVHIKDLQSEEQRDILIDLKLDRVEEDQTKHSIVRGVLSYSDQDDNLMKEEIVGQVLRMNGTDPLSIEINEKIDEQRNRLKVSEAVVVAKRLADQRKYQDAKKLYEETIKDVINSPSNSTPLSLALVKDLEEQKRLVNERSYESSGTSQRISSYSQSLSYQRTSSKSHTSGTYSRSRKKRSLESKKKTFFK